MVAAQVRMAVAGGETEEPMRNRGKKGLNAAKVIAVGPGDRDRDGKLIPVSLSEGDTVLLPEYGGTEVKLAEKEYVNICMLF
ncbi:unnamed protein product [Miscanthus lutarioriparius]|uniref:Chaperonin 10 n=1 Tax=Miscanthus lutarioriparius TaxID=422564 RepID=A0A811PQF2_9POAL|nr:unnamed protein product [Miscanthus lutarioriparius]